MAQLTRLIFRAVLVVLLAVAFAAGSSARAADCNTNGVPDFQDIDSGTSEDCNTNSRPDECEAGLPFGPTFRISENSNNEGGDAPSFDCAVSADGRYAAFYSDASNLTEDDLSGTNVFVADRATRVVENVHVTSEGEPADDNAFTSIDLTPDGRFVAFATNADLTAVNAPWFQVYLVDRETDWVELISRGPDGESANAWSAAPAISPDGRYVAFWSVGGNLIENDNNGATDVFRLDRQTGEMIAVSVNSEGELGNWHSGDQVVNNSWWMVGSHQIAISADARFVAFCSAATNLVTGDTNSRRDVFVHDCETGVTERVSVSSSGEQGNGASGGDPNQLYGYAAGLDITADGRFVAFESVATNLVADDPTESADIYIRDRLLGTTTRVPFDRLTAEPVVRHPVLTDDGRHIAFADIEDVGSPPEFGRVWVYGRLADRFELVGRNQLGQEADAPAMFFLGVNPITPNGRFVAFSTSAKNLTPDPNQSGQQVLLRDMRPDCNNNGTPSELQSSSQTSGTPSLEQSETLPAKISHTSGRPLVLQSGWHSSGTPSKLQSLLLPPSRSQASARPSELQS